MAGASGFADLARREVQLLVVVAWWRAATPGLAAAAAGGGGEAWGRGEKCQAYLPMETSCSFSSST